MIAVSRASHIVTGPWLAWLGVLVCSRSSPPRIVLRNPHNRSPSDRLVAKIIQTALLSSQRLNKELSLSPS